MFNEAKAVTPWDLADPRTMKSNFSSKSFYIVIDGLACETVRQAASSIKQALKKAPGVRVKGPLALPTERRRNLILRELKSEDSRGLYCKNVKRIRNVMLVMRPTAEAIASLIALPLPAGVNIQIKPYEDDGQYELKDS